MSSGNFARAQRFISGVNHDKTSKPPSFLAFRSSQTFIVVVVCLAIFTDILCYGLIVPVMPFSLTVQASVPEDQVQQWTAILLACYNAALVVGSPIAGIYADHTSSRRWPLLLGLLALCACTLLLCLAKSVALLVLGRLLQGLSAAIVWTVGLALLVDTVGRDIGQAMGWVSIAMAVGLLIAPVIGGAIYDSAGYYAVFYIAFAVIFCDIVLRLVLIEKKVARQWLDGTETLADDGVESSGGTGIASTQEPSLSGVGVDASAEKTGESHRHVQNDNDDVQQNKEETLIPQPLPQAEPQQSIRQPDSGGALGAATVHGAEARVQASDARPVAVRPHHELIKSRRILAVLLGVVIEAVVVFAFDTVVPIHVKDTFHWNSTAAGIIFICVTVPAFGSPVVGKLSDRYGAKWLSFFGFVTSVPPLVCLRFVTENTMQHKVLLCVLLTLLGITMLTFANTPLLAEMTYAIEAKEHRRPGIWGEKGIYGIAYGLWTTAFALGGTIGSIMAGYINAGPGWGTLTWVLGLWSALGAIVCFGLGPKGDEKMDERSSSNTPGASGVESVPESTAV
ncbi:major facilitator superfamily domain-containing protein [Rhypophila decipiens]|uniref:Major facilitator superfamily domain-containing protein n=1 Tax=Rhypophila decipiens TaxID=261697 RepID=A0AAN6YHB8_9PEZI|nr:major facilitator superfamily domain-containing protein [Rhypophila decipiens]